MKNTSSIKRRFRLLKRQGTTQEKKLLCFLLPTPLSTTVADTLPTGAIHAFHLRLLNTKIPRTALPAHSEYGSSLPAEANALSQALPAPATTQQLFSSAETPQQGLPSLTLQVFSRGYYGHFTPISLSGYIY